MLRNICCVLLANCMFATVLTNLTSAALISASDNAAHSDYTGGWDNTDFGNWGSGWTLNITSGAGRFVATSTANGNGDNNADGDIDTGGRAWGLFANSGGLAEAFRSFARPMQAGDSFSLDIDTGFIDASNTVGFGLQTSGGTNRAEVFFIGGNANYTVQGSSGTNSGVGFTDEGLTVRIDITGSETFTATLTPKGGSSTVLSGLSMANTGAGAITRFRLFNANAGFDADSNAYFNSISVVPEPSSLSIAAFGAIFIGALFLRRKAV